jgi:phosphatidylglycerophosphate synthase
MTTRVGVFDAGPRLLRSVVVSAAVAFVGLLVGAIVLGQTLALSDLYPVKAMAGFALVVALMLRFLPEHRPHRRIGPANQITLFRAVLTALLFGLVGEGGTASIAWTAFLIALIAEALDGLDGWLARHRGWTSAFGARLDMEIDALLVAVLALLVWSLDKAGIWVLAAGLLRYLFVVAGLLLPWMRRSLPPSRRRQTACVVQVLTLTLALSPLLSAPMSAAAAAAGLAYLCYSFAIDIHWLARRAGVLPESGELP